MKLLKSIYITGLIVILSGCAGVLDKQPLDIISDAVVWQDENLAQAYLADIYYRTDFVNLTRHRGYNQGMIASMGAEARTYGAWQQPYVASTNIINETGPASVDVEYWKYSNIRDANYFIEQMERFLLLQKISFLKKSLKQDSLELICIFKWLFATVEFQF